MGIRQEEIVRVDGWEQSIACMMRHITDEKYDRFTDPHYHEYIELLWGLEGETEVLVSGEKRSFSQGELMILNSKEPHTLRATTPYSQYIVVKFLPQLIYSGEQSVFELKYLLPFLQVHQCIEILIPKYFLQSFQLNLKVQVIHKFEVAYLLENLDMA